VRSNYTLQGTRGEATLIPAEDVFAKARKIGGE
jgi:hypothetical protein